MTTTEGELVEAGPDATIYERMLAVLRDLPAIGKNRENTQQNFKFRGIDDVLDALNPLLAKHGIFFVPHVLDHIEASRPTRAGSTMWVTRLHVQYTFYGLLGDSITASGWGEGTDNGDKATPKAMTGAMKYVLFQVFAIATTEQQKMDADRDTPPDTLDEGMEALIERFGSLPLEFQGKVNERYAKRYEIQGWDDSKDRIDWGRLQSDAGRKWITNVLDLAEAAVIKKQQDDSAEAGDTPAPEEPSQDPSDATTEPAASSAVAPSPEASAPEASAPAASEPEPDPEPTPDPAPTAQEEPPPSPDVPQDAPAGDVPADEPESEDTTDYPPVGTIPEDASSDAVKKWREIEDWVSESKGPAIQQALRDAELEIGGKVSEMKERLLEAYWWGIFFPDPEADQESAGEVGTCEGCGHQLDDCQCPPEVAGESSTEGTEGFEPSTPPSREVATGSFEQPEDQYSSMDNQKPAPAQVQVVQAVIGSIGTQEQFDQWVTWCIERNLDRDKIEDWSMGFTMRALDYLESIGL